VREAWNVKAVRKVLNPDRDERQSCHVCASCEQAHVVKRIAFMVVAPEENACDRSVIYSICFLPASRPRYPQFWRNASLADRWYGAVHSLWT